MALLDAGVPVKALAHITGDGLLNLSRIAAPDVGFVLDALPEPEPIFGLLAEATRVAPAEMLHDLQHGHRFLYRRPGGRSGADAGDPASHRAEGDGARSAVADAERKMVLPGPGLTGTGKTFSPCVERASAAGISAAAGRRVAQGRHLSRPLTNGCSGPRNGASGFARTGLRPSAAWSARRRGGGNGACSR